MGLYDLGLVICWEDTQDAAHSWTQSRFISMKEYKAGTASRKARGAKARGNQANATQSPLAVELHRTHLISPAMNCSNTCEVLSTTEAH